MFINFGNNANLDGMGFSPFARISEGMATVNKIYKCGEKPDQGQIQEHGNAYLKENFPELTMITSATVVGAHAAHPAALPAAKVVKVQHADHHAVRGALLNAQHHK